MLTCGGSSKARTGFRLGRICSRNSSISVTSITCSMLGNTNGIIGGLTNSL